MTAPPTVRPAPPPSDGDRRPPGGRPRVALVLGSGAVKCAAALGVRRVLEREGVPVDLLVGCSGGSLYAATWALGMPREEARRLTLALWRRGVMTKRSRRAVLGAVFPRAVGFDPAFGLVDDRPLLRALRGPFGGHRIEDAAVPLAVTATDFATGAPVVLREGSVLDAVRASIAVPFVWRPWEVGGRLLWDGCLSDPLPVGVAARAGADVVLAMGFESERPRRVSTALKFAFQVTAVTTNNLYRASSAHDRIAHGAAVVPVEPAFGRRVGLFDTGAIPAVIEAGARATEAALPALARALDGAR